MRVVVLALFGIVCAAAPALAQSAPSGEPRPSFDLATIKRNTSSEGLGRLHPNSISRFQTLPGGQVIATNYPLSGLIVWAYALPTHEIPEGPTILDERFDITAQAPTGTPIVPRGEIGPLNLMMQALLEERFRLRIKRDQREVTSYVLTRQDPSRLGQQMREFTGDCEALRLAKPMPGERIRRCNSFSALSAIGGEMATIATMPELAQYLSTLLEAPVADRTNLPGRFEMTARFETLDLPGTSRALGPRLGTSTTRDLPSLFSAFREDLGLRLEAQRAPSRTFTVESAERPTEN